MKYVNEGSSNNGNSIGRGKGTGNVLSGIQNQLHSDTDSNSNSNALAQDIEDSATVLPVPPPPGVGVVTRNTAASKLDEQALRELRVGLRNIQMFYTNYNRDPSAATDVVGVQVSLSLR